MKRYRFRQIRTSLRYSRLDVIRAIPVWPDNRLRLAFQYPMVYHENDTVLSFSKLYGIFAIKN